MEIRLKILSKTVLFFICITVFLCYEGRPFLESRHDIDVKIQINAVVHRLMQKYHVPGVAVASISKGEVDWVQGYGWRNDKKELVTSDTVFQVASNSKTIAAWGIMKLVESGMLDLDAPVNQYLSRWRLPDSKYDNNQVTIRRILSHTGGLSVRAYPGYLPGCELPSLEESLSGKINGLPELQVVMEPGIKYEYSGGGYTLLQLITEEITGVPFSQYMQAAILDPLGMKNSSYQWNTDVQEKIANGYDMFGKALPNFLFTEKAAAGLYTTAADFARFVAANMNSSKGEPAGRNIIKKTSLELMMTPVTPDFDYGLGYITKKFSNSKRLIHHGGANRGWRSQFALIPETGDGLVVLTNSDNGEKLHLDLVSRWTKWKANSLSNLQIKGIITRVFIKALALFLLGLLGVSFWNIGYGLISRKLAIGFENRQGKKVFVLWIRALIPTLVIIWVMLFYTDLVINGWIIASLMPSGFNWLTVGVVLWGVFLCLKLMVIEKNRLNRG